MSATMLVSRVMRLLANVLGTYFNWRAALCTLSASSSEILLPGVNARLTAAIETPANRATSIELARANLFLVTFKSSAAHGFSLGPGFGIPPRLLGCLALAFLRASKAKWPAITTCPDAIIISISRELTRHAKNR